VGSCTHSPAGGIDSAPAPIARRLWNAPAPLRLWHLASLDAPTVALVWSWAFAWAAGVRLHTWAPVALALIAWAIYIADRLLDARAGMQSPPLHFLRERHRFHWRYRRVLVPIVFLAAGAAAWLVLTNFPRGVRLPETALAAATLAYFSEVHARGRLFPSIRRRLAPFASRAFLIGTIFTAGCLLPVASQLVHTGGMSVARSLALPALFLAALAWLNCRAIGQWESSSPELAGRPVAYSFGLVICAGALLALLLARAEPRPAELVAAGTASALLLGMLHRLRHRLTPLALRAAADLVLLTPALLFLSR
jgi:hypothetical protein